MQILDSDVANYMEGILTQQGIDLKLGKQVKSIARNDAGSLDVTIADKDGNEEVVSGDKVLISTEEVLMWLVWMNWDWKRREDMLL